VPVHRGHALNTAVRGKLTMRNAKWGWKWKGGTIDGVDVGDRRPRRTSPSASTIRTACRSGGRDPSIATRAGRPIKRGYQYRDRTFANHGMEKVKIKTGTPSLSAVVQVKGRGALPPLRRAADHGAAHQPGQRKCWSVGVHDATPDLSDRFLAVIP